ncbi:MAG TPA: DUF1697 domain-containing protein [Pyrinomonadaceae bacterium]|nr:DUF1697 domain-containing protein [Pyrinomonadaceae bacterium]
MSQYIAFLRAINVGGHTVKMDRLREIFETLGYANVQTFIASGNVLFEAGAGKALALEKKIELSLKTELGYEVTTFIRKPEELTAIVRHRPLPDENVDGHTLYVGFTTTVPTRNLVERVGALSGAVDELSVNGREIYWLCRKSFSESGISGALVEKTLGMPVTIRNINTVRRILAKLGTK